MEITPSINLQNNQGTANAMPDSEKIRAQAKKIMDEFMTALDKAENTNLNFGEERQSSTREKINKHVGNQEADGQSNSFRTLMFNNAPKKNDDYIIAEKKKW